MVKRRAAQPAFEAGHLAAFARSEVDADHADLLGRDFMSMRYAGFFFGVGGWFESIGEAFAQAADGVVQRGRLHLAELAQGSIRWVFAVTHLRHREPLREIDARMAAAQVGKETGGGDVHRLTCPKKFDAHQRTREWSVRCSGEDSHKAQGGEQVRRRTQQRR